MVLSTEELGHFIGNMAILLFASHSVGFFFEKLKMPKVIGEIGAGILLGPSILGHFSPRVQEMILPMTGIQKSFLALVYWLGLLLLMFISGLKMEDQNFSTKDKKLIFILLFGATIVPFLICLPFLSLIDFGPFLGRHQNLDSFKIVLLVAVSVTSIPVLSKIFFDLGIFETKFAKIVLATSSIQDVILWGAIGLATNLVSHQSVSSLQLVMMVVKTYSFMGATLWIGPKIVKAYCHSRLNYLVHTSPVGFALIVCFIMCYLAHLLDINLIFGALLAGFLCRGIPLSHLARVKEQILPFSLSFFVPVYFCIVGLKIDLPNHFSFLPFICFLLFSTLLEGMSVLLASYMACRHLLTGLNFGVAMNARGGPGIVMASMTLEAGIISESFYVILVLTAIFTSLGAGAWFRWILSRDLPLYSPSYSDKREDEGSLVARC